MKEKIIVQIEKFSKPSKELWEDIYNNCDYATYFHSIEFSELLTEYDLNLSIASKVLKFSDGKKCILILFDEKKFGSLIKWYNSSAYGLYGGWISSDDLNESHVKCIYKYFKQINITVRFNPFYKHLIPQEKTVTDDFTQILSLGNDYESIHSDFEYRHKHAIKRAKEKGVVITLASSIEEWKEYYLVYEDSIRRWGVNARSHYNWQLFNILYNSNSEKIKLFIASKEEKIISGALCFSDKGKMHYWHGAYLEEYKNLSPVTCLIGEIIRNSVGKVAFFDFLPSGGLEGVFNFKKGYNPEIISNQKYFNTTIQYKILSKLSTVLLRK